MIGNKTPDTASLTVIREERLTDELLGLAVKIKISDATGQPVQGLAFQVHADTELLLKAATDENGEYKGQRVIQVQADAQRKVFLVLEGSSLTDWVMVPSKPENEGIETSSIDYKNFSIDYKNFSEQLCVLRPDEVGLYVANYDSSMFIHQFRLLVDPKILEPEYINKTRVGAKLQLNIFLGTEDGPWSKIEVSSLIDGWVTKLRQTILSETLERKKEKLISDLERVKAVLLTEGILEEILGLQLLDNLYEKIKKGGDMRKFMEHGHKLKAHYPVISSVFSSTPIKLNKQTKELARKEIKNMFGRDVEDCEELKSLLLIMRDLINSPKADALSSTLWALHVYVKEECLKEIYS